MAIVCKSAPFHIKGSVGLAASGERVARGCRAIADMPRRAQIDLNKGEAHHALKNALRIRPKVKSVIEQPKA